MSREESLIRKVTALLPAAPERRTPVYSSDCEVAELEGVRLLCTMDDFSAEDQMRQDDPERLGWNLACAALADVFACGGKARLYSHAMVPSADWSDLFVESFTHGVAAALRACGAGFLGGDWGHGGQWRYTAQVIGTPGERIVDRRGARSGDVLYVTGRLGLGNLEAAMLLYGEHPLLRRALGLYQPRFRLLHREAELVASFASAAIDTSDGLASCLLQLADQSEVGFEVDSVPYLQMGRLASRVLRKPESMLALGGCGEYEILFSVPQDREGDLQKASRDRALEIHKIGNVHPSGSVRRLRAGRGSLDLRRGFPRARDFSSLSDYLRELETFASQGEP